MKDYHQIIQLLVAPVVMISACGLLCLALYARLAAVVGRARAFHKEWLDALAELQQAEPGALETQLRRRGEMLDDQVHRILARARLIRGSLVFLLITVLSMLACSLALGMAKFDDRCAGAALALFVAGALSEMVGVSLAIIELFRALDPVRLEHSHLEAQCEECGS